MNRRGFILDAVPIVVSLFIAAIMIFVALKLMGAINDGVQELTGTESAAARTIVSDTNDDIAWVLDFVYVMLLIALPLTSMILAFLNNIPPFFFWASIGIMLAIVFLGGALADSWIMFGTDQSVSDTMSRVPITNMIMNNFGIYAFFVVVIIAAGVFIKTRSQGGYYQ